MQEIAISSRFIKARDLAFKWRCELAIPKKIVLALGMACLTGLVAQIKVFLPWTPVPITGQTFAVLLAGILLGKYWGGISQALYVVIGAIGMPWFADGNGGFVYLLTSPTGGYLVGFILAALFLGYFSDQFVKARNFIPMLILMLFANFVLLHGPGLVGLGLWFSRVKGMGLSVGELWLKGTYPFVIGDIIKILLAAAITKGITPKKAFDAKDENY